MPPIPLEVPERRASLGKLSRNVWVDAASNISRGHLCGNFEYCRHKRLPMADMWRWKLVATSLHRFRKIHQMPSLQGGFEFSELYVGIWAISSWEEIRTKSTPSDPDFSGNLAEDKVNALIDFFPNADHSGLQYVTGKVKQLIDFRCGKTISIHISV
jgi:hypothetical protein